MDLLKKMSLNIQKVVNDRIAIIIVIVGMDRFNGPYKSIMKKKNEMVDLRKLKRNVSFPYSNHHFHQHHNPDDLLPFAGNGVLMNFLFLDIILIYVYFIDL